MFNIITDMVENVLDVTGDLLTGEVPTKRAVAKLIGDGISIATIAVMFDTTTDIITDLLKDDNA